MHKKTKCDIILLKGIIMPRHFHKTFQSPYFQSDRYKNSIGGKREQEIETFFKKIYYKFLGIFIKSYK